MLLLVENCTYVVQKKKAAASSERRRDNLKKGKALEDWKFHLGDNVKVFLYFPRRGDSGRAKPLGKLEKAFHGFVLRGPTESHNGYTIPLHHMAVVCC